MSRANNFIKKSLTAIIATSALTFNGWSQTSTIWSTIEDYNNLQLVQNDSGVVSSAINEIQTIINNYEILSIRQILPNSRKKNLFSVYEITCNCDETDLLTEISKQTQYFSNPEIGPNYQPLYEPNDYTINFSEDYALDLIRAKDAWDITHGDSSIVIAISDQNFYTNHEDLQGKWEYYDSTNVSPKNHGTAVAVTAAGKTNNSQGKSAIGFNSKLAFYQMSYNDILIATYSGSRVINLSWASGCTENGYVQGVIDEAYENGSIIVCAAGNGGTCGGANNLVFPSACNHVISVTGIGPNDNHERFLNDPTVTCQHNSTVDISAPGYDMIISGSPGVYEIGTGSSFSAPLVSGTIALMLSVDSCLTFDDVEYILYSTSHNIDDLNPTYVGLIGSGRLDAGAALELCQNYNACVITPVIDSSLYDNSDVSKSPSSSSTNSVSINEISDASFQFYPNPVSSNGIIYISLDLQISLVTIFDLSGNKVQVESETCNKILLNNLTSGIYIVQLTKKDQSVISKKLMIK